MEGNFNGNGNSSIMAFGENSSGLCSMMMPLVTSYHATHHHNNTNNSTTTTNPNLNHANPNPNAISHNSPVFLPMICTYNNDNHPNRNSSGSGTSSIMLENHNNHHGRSNNSNTGLGYFMEIDDTNNNDRSSSSSSSSAVKAKIMAHPHYHRLLAAYVNCQKVGAPAQVVARLEEACASAVTMGGGGSSSYCIGEDPALDQFMEAYCEMLIKYEQELSKPFKEAMLFLQRIECQFNSLTISPSSHFAGNKASDENGSSEDTAELPNNNGIDLQAEDRELKGQLLRKYSGYLGSLKQEFMKKRKKGKLPKEARQQLLEWWSRHYKWPYPSESQKVGLAESTGLDQKQINNWFINQRKRHWKPSEDMQFVVVDPSSAHPHYYMDNNLLGNPFPMDLSHTML